jgi:hypothetical protein
MACRITTGTIAHSASGLFAVSPALHAIIRLSELYSIQGYKLHYQQTKTKTSRPESASELFRPRDLRLLAMLVPTFMDRGCRVVSVTDPYGRILDFSRQQPLIFLSNSSSLVPTRLSGPRSRPNTSQKI